MFRYKRLMFGISCAPERFQKIMEQLLSKCKNVIVFQDDILIYGKTDQDHDDALKEVLRILTEHGILLQTKKCLFKVEKAIFVGNALSRDGVNPTQKKIEAIESFRRPNTASEIRSFLGLVGYVGRFIPHLATKTCELRNLMTSKEAFQWNETHEEAFNELKRCVTSAPILAYFDNNRKTRVIADASPFGLGAVLVQFEDETSQKPVIISYASKSLSATERRYC